MAERIVCSVGDAVLRQVDVDSLHVGFWLTDAVLTFFLTDLNAPQDCLLVDASVAFFLACCSVDDVSIIAGPLGLASRELVVVPVSNSASPELAYSGSHWALLAVWPRARRFVLYDSLGPLWRSSCAANAGALATALSAAYGFPVPDVLDGHAPRQVNNADCGLHALLTAEALVLAHATGTEVSLTAVTPEAACKLRSRISNRVAQLSSERSAITLDD
jgi:hypothetical protein